LRNLLGREQQRRHGKSVQVVVPSIEMVGVIPIEDFAKGEAGAFMEGNPHLRRVGETVNEHRTAECFFCGHQTHSTSAASGASARLSSSSSTASLTSYSAS